MSIVPPREAGRGTRESAVEGGSGAATSAQPAVSLLRHSFGGSGGGGGLTQQVGDGLDDGAWLRRLGHKVAAPPLRADRVGFDLAGIENEWNPMPHEQPGDGGNALRPDPHVENSSGNAAFLDKRERLPHGPAGARDFGSGFTQNPLQLHQDQKIILDDQDGGAAQ
jgi:hypothetical protein